MRTLVVYLVVMNVLVLTLAAQNPGTPEQGGDQPDQSMQHTMDMPGMNMTGMEMPGMKMSMSAAPDWVPSAHISSGTGWQPAAAGAANHGWMKMVDGWELMAHGAVFLDYNQQGGPRGEGKAESVNMAMLMQQHSALGGTVLFREMFSAESLTSPHPGFPELFQTGETYHGQPLVDHQHPHNVFAELAFDYTHPVGERVSWLFYGGAVGEPALGPVAYLHRVSATELPLAPLSHHLQDSTHISFGVLTTGLVISRLKIEGSVFNGREPEEKRYNIQFAPLDSWSARLSVAASRNWTMQYSYGRLERPEALEPGSQFRQTASIEYVRPLGNGTWATTLVWGRVHKVIDNHNLNGYLVESTLNFKSRYYAFTRMELVDKDELFPGDPLLPTFRIGAYTFGGERDLLQRRLWQLGLGTDVTFYSKPSSLNAAYGANPVSFQVFLRARPALSHHQH